MDRCIMVTISGIVQGVWFRESARKEADRLGLVGWVRNREDGRVEAYVQGPDDRVEQMLEWARVGPSLARVERVDVQPVEPAAQLRHGFEIRR